MWKRTNFGITYEINAVRSIYRKAMDALYLACVLLAGTALVLISAVIPWAVYTRYVLNQAASWPEPMAVLLTIVLTFFGAAACYRRRLHMNVSFFVAMLPPRLRRIADLIAELLVALFALFMAVWGVKLVEATWYNTIADFPALSVGVTYVPIPLGGAILLLFVVERVGGGQRTDVGGRMTEQGSLKDQPSASVLRHPSSDI